MVDMRLEVVMIPVADVDRAKEFYSGIGFHLDVDHQPNEDFRVVQFTPPASACSITFGIGIGTAEPGSVQGTHLVVSDIEAAVTELSETGVEVDPIRHMTPSGWAGGPAPQRENYASFSGFRDPDGNSWVLQEVGFGSSREERHEPSHD